MCSALRIGKDTGISSYYLFWKLSQIMYEETDQHLGQDTLHPCLESNLEPPEYERDLITN
jgi:hypothetical protein